LEAHLDSASGIDKPWRRNAAIVWLELTFDKITRASELGLSQEGNDHPTTSNGLPERIVVIVQYLQKYGSTSVAYEDTRPLVQKLQPAERTKLLDILLSNSLDASYKTDTQQLETERKSLSPRNQDVSETSKTRTLWLSLFRNTPEPETAADVYLSSPRLIKSLG
jgi:N-terminal acetyltransferase B complex non-catalytic subunit